MIKIIKTFYCLTIFLFTFFFLNLNYTQASDLAVRLAGKILLQVEENGEAWYVNPISYKRSFLGRPDDAFAVMREQGIGITNSDLAKIPVSLDYLSGKDSSGDGLPDDFKVALGLDVNSTDSDGDGYSDYEELLHGFDPLGPGRLNYDLDFAKSNKGKIFLQVESHGEAWYVSPENNKRYFLGRPADAFSIMRELGLGISNSDLDKIEIKLDKEKLQTFNWRYNNQNYSLDYIFKTDIFLDYNQDEKIYTYYTDNEPEDLRDAYYSIFFKIKEGDNQTFELLDILIKKANENNYIADQKIEFILAFIQYIPYDFDKAKSKMPIANFPFETLYLNQGVCTDTTFLSIMWLRELGYGSAVLDFPDSNHAALGISCPIEYSLNNTGYCYVETTNYFPFGVIPTKLSAGQAKLEFDYDHDYFSVENLGPMEIRQSSVGREYNRITENILVIETIKELKKEIDLLLIELEKDDLENRNQVISNYNELIKEYNQLINDFYQL